MTIQDVIDQAMFLAGQPYERTQDRDRMFLLANSAIRGIATESKLPRARAALNYLVNHAGGVDTPIFEYAVPEHFLWLERCEWGESTDLTVLPWEKFAENLPDDWRDIASTVTTPRVVYVRGGQRTVGFYPIANADQEGTPIRLYFWAAEPIHTATFVGSSVTAGEGAGADLSSHAVFWDAVACELALYLVPKVKQTAYLLAHLEKERERRMHRLDLLAGGSARSHEIKPCFPADTTTSRERFPY